MCEEHHALRKECPCSRPFSLFSFPSIKRSLRKREIRLINRTMQKNTRWTQGQSDMVFSLHFVDGRPTFRNPYPTENLGYDKCEKKPRRKFCRQELPVSNSQMTPEKV